MATIYDVARLSGHAPSTVSRVLHGKNHVAPATRTDVLAAIEALNYQPNLLAQHLSNLKS
ncbi:LacI family DNA-binding transcriptional regulator [Lactobacillus selangorensis]|uniref:LacI family DNA-binding transcriptional regulator n=1 Tax=Lactobacillus selangorensis TaxID=81857 RepID=UPI00070930EE|nr:LacI family DNA-binding transcriptional regulator [Lactobacillus selangorensis]